ncbi:HigA family addiction module antitoxin [Sphingobium algorifonticola]|uniref:Addiction module antidote protein, HigA family n=1 Tax=Sphingobium algorifonticola TaxID=2008318 RepID=A0A437J3A9_9SPHN|nr:HigA family addiction module antitoxin [Sphingobium algorifonticola]RVT38763.1 addiction module antidote protein, HigA family [Sphingobium algorifonticola]
MQTDSDPLLYGHPGGFLKSAIIEANGLSVTDAAQVLGVTRPALSALLNGRSDLTPQMAIRIEKAFGVSIEQLMEMQTSFDIAEIRKRADEIIVAPFRPKTASARRGHG